MTVIAVGLQLAANDPDSYKAGPIGLLLLLLLGVAIVFLARSMGRHLRKVPASFEAPPDDAAGARSGADRTITDGTTGSGSATTAEASTARRVADDDSDGERGPATR